VLPHTPPTQNLAGYWAVQAAVLKDNTSSNFIRIAIFCPVLVLNLQLQGFCILNNEEQLLSTNWTSQNKVLKSKFLVNVATVSSLI
jgi:hypothetical protein